MAVAPMPRERLCVVDLDDPGQCRLVVLLAQVPALGPGELCVRNALAGVGHPLKPQIGGVGQNRGQDAARVLMDLSGSKLSEHRREPSQGIDLSQKFCQLFAQRFVDSLVIA